MTEEIRRWVQEKTDIHCNSCPNTCCDGTKHVISMDSNDRNALALFAENSIPLYGEKELDADSVEDWLKGGYTGPLLVRTKTRKKIRKPALIEHKAFELSTDNVLWTARPQFSLYVDPYCPFYDEAYGCLVHNDERRPTICREYPVFIEDHTASFAISCPKMSSRETRIEFSKRFPEIAIIVR